MMIMIGKKMPEDFNTRQTLLFKIKDQYDDKSWEDFVFYYKGFIYLVIKSLGVNESEINDLSQKVILKLWKTLPEFTYKPGECKFKTWMTTVIRNTVFNYFTASKRYKQRLENVGEMSEKKNTPDIYKIAEKNWKTHISNLAWSNIKDGFTEINQEIFLLYAKGFKADEIAKQTDQKLNTVYVVRKRILENLNKEIRRLQDELG